MPPILLTAFEPFGGAAMNASLEAARLLAATDTRIALVALPVARGEAEQIALRALADTRPVLFVSLGEAKRPSVTLEKAALNWDDFRIPDNAGNQPRDEAIVPDGPAAYFATLPAASIAAALQGKTPLPVTVSLSAGSFLCNHVAYCVSHALARDPLCPYGFVHVPAVRPGDQTTVEEIAETLRAVLAAAGVDRVAP